MVWVCDGDFAAAGAGLSAGALLGAVADIGMVWGAAGEIPATAAAATGAGDGSAAGCAADAEGATERGSRRAAISTTVQRFCGSRCRQCRVISRKTAGKVSGTTGSCRGEGSATGRRWVKASTRVMPNDQMSPAAVIAPLAASGGSYAVGWRRLGATADCVTAEANCDCCGASAKEKMASLESLS